MYKALTRLLAAVFAVTPLSIAAHATAIPIGYVSYDVTGVGVAQFDIVNLTGANSSPTGDSSFPVVTPISLSNLSLTVDYAGGGSHIFDSSYFTLDADGLSFDGKQLSILAGAPTGLFGATDATLTGTFSTRSFTLNDGTQVTVYSGFSASILGSGRALSDGDLAVVDANAIPEPATWTMLVLGLAGVAGMAATRRTRGRTSVVTLIFGCALLLLPVTSKAATIKLNTLTSPSAGTSGSSSVSVTGSGFPSGTISAGNVSISLSSSCGGPPTLATASSVQKIIGTSDRIQFAIPGGLTAGSYFVSVSGTDSNSVSFSSGSSCSTLQVNAAASALSIDTTNPVDWKISNGALSIDFNSQAGNIFGIFPTGTTDNLIDLTNRSKAGPKGFYMDNAGVGTATGVPGYSNSGGYIDWWVTYPSNSTNAYTYSEHFIVTPNDPAIHIYFVANHAASDIAGAIGQIQWVLRGDLDKFPNTYSVNTDLSNPGPTATPLPPASDIFSTDPGRAVQDATDDLHGFTDIPAGFTRSFYTKYDYSSYEYLHRAHGVYGSKYGAWVVLPSNESLAGGPTKQDLIFTGNLDIMEAFSGHLDNAISLRTPAGVASQRLFGPYYFRFNTFGSNINTPADMYQDAVIAGTSFSNFYNNETQLLASGYVPSNARGTVQVHVNGVSGSPKTAWVVLSDPAKNFQYSSQGAQYWADISNSGSATIPGVIPGTYRASVYVLGQWGELRQEGIVVNAGQTTTVPTMSFIQENFGSSAPVFTIGTADRSSHEFLHGHDAAGHDDREFWGAWNYWADFQANQGAVIYNATDGPAGAATNDLSKWNYNHWQIFDPGLYGGVYNPSDDTTDGYKYAIPNYVTALPGASGTNGVTTHTPPWVVHFASPQDAARNAYAVLSVALAAAEANYTVSLNGQPLTWSKLNASDSAVRSGLSGYTQWVAFQWDSSVLSPAGKDNVLTFSVNSTQGDQDDALRLELTNTSADPAVRGWHDYEFLYKSIDTKADDTQSNP